MKFRIAIGAIIGAAVVSTAIPAFADNEPSGASPAVEPAPTSADLAPIPDGGPEMPASDYELLAEAVRSNPDATNDDLASRSRSRVLLVAPAGRTLSMVTSENGAVCVTASRGGAPVAGGCSEHLRGGVVEPFVTQIPAVGGNAGSIEVFGLAAADVASIKVVLDDGGVRTPSASPWAFWWTAADSSEIPVSLIVERASGAVSSIPLEAS